MHRWARQCGGVARFQSPLHRGAARGTAEADDLDRTIVFQSPLHRGAARGRFLKPLFQNGLDAAFYAEIS